MSEKAYTFYFYQLVPADAENGLRALFNSHIEKGTNIPQSMMNDEYHIQVQHLKPHKTPTDLFALVSGVIKKYAKKNPPKIGEVGVDIERPIKMTPDEALIEETYFLYSFSHHVLLYQSNFQGTPCSQFTRYLSAEQLGSDVSFEPLLTYETYKMLEQDDIKLKKFDVSFGSPTNPNILPGNSGDWSDNALSFLTAAEGSKMTISVTGGMRGSSGKGLSAVAKDFILSLAGKLNRAEESTSGLHGKVELIDEEHDSHLLDLVANRLSVIADVTMDGRYPKESAILAKMMEIMEENEPEIRSILER